MCSPIFDFACVGACKCDSGPILNGPAITVLNLILGLIFCSDQHNYETYETSNSTQVNPYLVDKYQCLIPSECGKYWVVEQKSKNN